MCNRVTRKTFMCYKTTFKYENYTCYMALQDKKKLLLFLLICAIREILRVKHESQNIICFASRDGQEKATALPAAIV